jgi:hypothetical protein
MPLPSQVGQLQASRRACNSPSQEAADGLGCHWQWDGPPPLSFARIWVSTQSSVSYLPAHVNICMYMYVYLCILHVYAHIYNYMHVYSSICMYMYVYVCICMYNSEMGFKTHKYKKQYMQVYSCICMYIHMHPLGCQRMGQKRCQQADLRHTSSVCW